MEKEALFAEVSRILSKEPKLIELPPHGKAVFVGDTHGDLDATEKVISRYLKGTSPLIFLGDYVDRGDSSQENIDFLLQQKQTHPQDLILLAGNHEGYMTKPFSPSNFWEGLLFGEQEIYASLFSQLPLAVTTGNGVLALHGGLPEFDSLEEINQVKWGDGQWERILWGDFVENEEDVIHDWGGRPQLGRRYFDRMMKRYRKKVLIRSHQPFAPLFLFGKRCVTIFTSYAYVPERHVAILDLEKELKSGEDLVLQKV